LGDNPKALDAANRSLTYFIGERDIRGAAATLGIIANAAASLGDDEMRLYGLAGSIGLARYMGGANAATARDLEIHEADLEEFRASEPLRYATAREAIEPRLRELERALRTSQLQTGL
jgi:hypothetical protein